jgi:hypothetical protein
MKNHIVNVIVWETFSKVFKYLYTALKFWKQEMCTKEVFLIKGKGVWNSDESKRLDANWV